MTSKISCQCTFKASFTFKTWKLQVSLHDTSILILSDPVLDPHQLFGSGSSKKVRIHSDPDPQHWQLPKLNSTLWLQSFNLNICVPCLDVYKKTRVESHLCNVDKELIMFQHHGFLTYVTRWYRWYLYILNSALDTIIQWQKLCRIRRGSEKDPDPKRCWKSDPDPILS